MQGSVRGADRRCRALVLTAYAALALLVMTEKWGRATSDTRFELTEVPGPHLAGTFQLWNPDVSLGELQNQAYGYLFPQGSFFVVLEALGAPGWVAQRLWSVLVLLVACEGLRRLALALGIGPWGAAVAGLAYGLVPRHVTEIGTRSAEILPAAVLPWALLPIVLAIAGRMRPVTAAVLSAAAFACSGGVNGTATAAPAALLAVVVGWAVWRRRLSWRFGLGWLALVGAVSAWWLLSLLRLGAFSPPFYDFVEDARATTSTSGFGPVLRGASNWVGYITVGGERWWPAGYDLGYQPWLVFGSGVVALLGFVGLMRMRSPLRTPLLVAAGFGLTCQVIAHTGTLDSPLSQYFQDLLDGPLAPLRNVPKVDPVLRVPLMLGVGVLVDEVLRVAAARRAATGSATGSARGRWRTAWRGRWRRGAAVGVALALGGGLLAMAQPIATADTRTPGWEEVPEYWSEAADFLAERAQRGDESGGTDGTDGATWVVPGSGFGIEQWGWTMEEPMEAVGRTPWVTRSQVPLTPPETIRQLSAMEAFLETGAGSPYLRHLLNRMGIDTILVRHDLEPDVSQATSASLVGVALGRSPGLELLSTFGELEFGPAIEVYAVAPPIGAVPEGGGYDIRDVDDAVTVAGSIEAAVAAVGSGLVGPSQAMVLAGTEGWDRAAEVVGDGYARRERSFGQIHDALSTQSWGWRSVLVFGRGPAHEHSDRERRRRSYRDRRRRQRRQRRPGRRAAARQQREALQLLGPVGPSPHRSGRCGSLHRSLVERGRLSRRLGRVRCCRSSYRRSTRSAACRAPCASSVDTSPTRRWWGASRSSWWTTPARTAPPRSPVRRTRRPCPCASCAARAPARVPPCEPGCWPRTPTSSASWTPTAPPGWTGSRRPGAT